jgi:hypothetical protein
MLFKDHNERFRHVDTQYLRLIDEGVDESRLAAYFSAAHQFMEHVENDKTGCSKVKRSSVKKLRGTEDFLALTDVALSLKHRNVDFQVVSHSSATHAYGVARYGKGAFGVGEPKIVFKDASGGVRLDALDLVKRVHAELQKLGFQ